ncbi:MetQ/NlpA family ABC transporter substrate-binding protein [Ochrobactrum sp. AN78]|uniref:MetQ/NlpA family ABC transporter substrate-binding protein n=1 Tax=Ochrobactrum sp. AN78 TaxID=3039853 RepID=UPI00298A0529|nr:MetQ/NlpA family ABC transporter substrate-binding protein [Ochrobactrum sp. AN78]MDH7793247.1 D-methionine transport system substrate-binding protein [Ochrobactrum sp. AN78]
MIVLRQSLVQNVLGKPHRRRFLLLSVAMLFGLSLPIAVHAKDKGTLRIALATSISNQAVEIAVAEAKEQGLNVELVEFSDWNTPNTAVADKTVDANLFQHIPYLNYTNSNTGNGLVPVAPAFSTPFGLYSKKYSKLADLPDNAQIAFSGDVINTGRSLLLLQQAGFLDLKPGKDQRASLEDVLTWKKPLKIVQLDGPQIARSLDDVDAAATYPTFAKLAGLEASSGLIFENEPIYAFQFVTRPELRDDPRLKQFIEIYQNSSAVKAKLHELYGDMVSFPR